jgi:hypothetical protein
MTVGRSEGLRDGTELRTVLGWLLGANDGKKGGPDDAVELLRSDGMSLWILLGRNEGKVLATSVGKSLGSGEGTLDCITVGIVLEAVLGSLESTSVGYSEGRGDGTALRTVVGVLLGEADDPDDGLVLLCNDGASLVILLGTVLG